MSKYDDQVFINCPFDEGYAKLFRSIVFAVHDAGFVPRCALSIDDGARPRIEKLLDMIGECRYGIHDISRTELDPKYKLPRFNMPLELGLFLGARRYGTTEHRKKRALILDTGQFRFQKFISDIAGYDIQPHAAKPRQAIRVVRNWLRSYTSNVIPGGAEIYARYKRFETKLPAICKLLKLDRSDLSFPDLSRTISDWLLANPW